MPRARVAATALLSAGLLAGAAVPAHAQSHAQAHPRPHAQRDPNPLTPDGPHTPPVPEPAYELLDGPSRDRWPLSSDRFTGASDHLVLMVHGLDEVGAIFTELSTELLLEGEHAALFVYPNDGAVEDNAGMLVRALQRVRAAGVEEVTLVGHSMGGLVSYDAVTRPREPGRAGAGQAGAGSRRPIPIIRRVITLGTPYEGAVLAHLQPISDVREHTLRWWDSDDMDPSRLLGWLDDGDGEAGRDLLPGSDLLAELESRDWPDGLPLTVIYAQIWEADNSPAPRRAEPEEAEQVGRAVRKQPAPRPTAVESTPTWVPSWAKPIYSYITRQWGSATRTVNGWTRQAVVTAAEVVGDGVVSTGSARGVWIAAALVAAGGLAEGDEEPAPVEFVPVRGTHSSMLYAPGQDAVGPGTAVVLERIREDRGR